MYLLKDNPQQIYWSSKASKTFAQLNIPQT